MDHNAGAPANGPLRGKVTITNPHGLHLRPAGAFAELATRFVCQVRVLANEKDPADGKSPLSMLGLFALPGTELTVEVDGPDAATALPALLDFLANIERRVDMTDPE